ncbi:hypothetical protein COCNU_16G003120 [Cocos nucifera]|uniref:Uncharacterized protein n=1 Tax=Cocos nucifera TaxID=13894 RepID=A0A8K0J0M1_COCNU|nr:hypothetical protein COCNU_16G003120 [Cocos nucifera]
MSYTAITITMRILISAFTKWLAMIKRYADLLPGIQIGKGKQVDMAFMSIVILSGYVAFTMQAQKTAPPDMQLRDKFLVQGTIVPYGTTDEETIPSFFSKENGRYIEENKMRVILVSPPHSPVLQPLNGALKQEPVHKAPDLKETPVSTNQMNGVENLHPFHVAKDAEDLKLKLNDLEVKLNEDPSSNWGSVVPDMCFLCLDIVQKEVYDSDSSWFSLFICGLHDNSWCDTWIPVAPMRDGMKGKAKDWIIKVDLGTLNGVMECDDCQISTDSAESTLRQLDSSSLQ